MGSVLVLFGVLGGAAALLIVTLLRRSRTRTENADGLLIEQDRRLQASSDRVSFSSRAAHSAPPTMGDSYRF
ncbi:hypothetical protein [Streptomyces sp. NBC_01216]|uniref:hypothetical protein n=1 Tax=unclassified Streptomyces TaxID=2593676 RepID=UPI002E0E2BF8|nr:hypothetical protein OG393_01015 [Streptomyces sp. NBC_01216]